MTYWVCAPPQDVRVGVWSGEVVEISDDSLSVLDPEMPTVTALGLCFYVGQLLPCFAWVNLYCIYVSYKQMSLDQYTQGGSWAWFQEMAGKFSQRYKRLISNEVSSWEVRWEQSRREASHELCDCCLERWASNRELLNAEHGMSQRRHTQVHARVSTVTYTKWLAKLQVSNCKSGMIGIFKGGRFSNLINIMLYSVSATSYF